MYLSNRLPVAQLEPAHAAGEAERVGAEAEVVERAPQRPPRHPADVERPGLEVELPHGALRAALDGLVTVQFQHAVRVPPFRLKWNEGSTSLTQGFLKTTVNTGRVGYVTK